MSKVMLSQHVPNVEFTADDVGAAVAHADCMVQVEFLLAFAVRTEEYDWPMQCRFISENMADDAATVVSNALSTLLDHLRERVAAAQ